MKYLMLLFKNILSHVISQRYIFLFQSKYSNCKQYNALFYIFISENKYQPFRIQVHYLSHMQVYAQQI